jgi:hypothetical protein
VVARYILQHRHEPRECGVVFASFKGHAIWWTVDAPDEADALRLLPAYVAERTTVARVNEVHIP